MLNRLLSRLQIRLTGAFILVALIPLIIVGVHSEQAAANALRQQALQTEANRVKSLAANIQKALQGTSDDVTFLARSAPLMELLEAIADGEPAAIARTRQELADEFIALAQTRSGYFKIRYIDATGQEVVEIAAQGNTFHVSQGDELQNEGQDDYFVNGMTLPEGQVYATRLRLETQGGVIITPHVPGIRYAAPVFYEGQRRGVMVTNLDARGFLDPLQKEADEGQKYLLLVDADGFYLSHPDEAKRWGGPTDLNTGERLTVDFPDLAAEVLGGQAGTTVAGGQMVAYAPVLSQEQTASPWTVIEVEPLDKALAPVASFRNVFLGLMALVLILAVGVGAYSARAITRPVVELSQVANQISHGDLTPEITVRGPVEVGQLARAFDQMTQDLRGLIQQMATTSGQVATASEELSAMTEEINASAGQVATTVQQVAQGATAQTDQAEDISRAIEALAAATDQIAQNAQQTEQVAEQARRGVNSLAEMMHALQRRSEDINSMAGTVKRFADQTNLLALNAAIEAARAGEHGKSFAVVADEVRRLAESSRHAVEEITTLNVEIQDEIQQVLTGMEDIVTTVNDTATMARQNAGATARQRQESDTVVRSVNDMASVTVQQATGAEEMAAAVEQQMASTEQLATAAQELSELAVGLQELTSRFRVRGLSEEKAHANRKTPGR
jgi:methyl-accepting chemotaxis protein